jgi:NTP pyrophosphatase (non-canonical NTP hydrolase)
VHAENVTARWDAASVGREEQIAAATAHFIDLVRLMADLRGPDGCPWDREQSLASLRQYVVEEANEVCDAIARILEFEASLRAAAGLLPDDPTPPEAEDKARTATKGLSMAHHPHQPGFDAAASASGNALPALTTEQSAQRDQLYAALISELGDLMLQGVFMGDILLAMDQPGVEGALAAIVAKLIRRHPHVYGEEEAASSAEVLANWERIKQAERTG